MISVRKPIFAAPTRTAGYRCHQLKNQCHRMPGQSPCLNPRRPIGPIAFKEAIAHRESRRKFTAQPLSLDELSFLLWSTQGVPGVASEKCPANGALSRKPACPGDVSGSISCHRPGAGDLSLPALPASTGVGINTGSS